MPVSKWMQRIVYCPAISYGVPKSVAVIIVFFVSAVFHELLVAVPLRMTESRYWAFWAMMAQASQINSDLLTDAT